MANHVSVAGSGSLARRLASEGVDAEQPQAGFGELVHGALLDSFRVTLAQPQQPEQAASQGAQRDLSIRDP